MKCDEEILFLYYEGECSDPQRSEMKEHLDGCSRCREKLERMKFTVESFSSLYAREQRSSCPEARDLVLYHDGQLEEVRTAEIFMHVQGCPMCIEELALIDACDVQEHAAAPDTIEPPPLSNDVLDGILHLRQRYLKQRMENVLKNLVSKGRDAITPEKITEIVAQYFAPAMTPVPVHALPAEAAYFDTELTLNDTAICDISVDIGQYSVSLRAVDDMLTVQVMRDGKGVSDVEVIVMTRYLGPRKALTGKDGIGVIVGIRQGPYQIKIRIPDDMPRGDED